VSGYPQRDFFCKDTKKNSKLQENGGEKETNSFYSEDFWVKIVVAALTDLMHFFKKKGNIEVKKLTI
jgi:hypothetical protein